MQLMWLQVALYLPEADLESLVRVVLHFYIVELKAEGLHGGEVTRRGKVSDCSDIQTAAECQTSLMLDAPALVYSMCAEQC